MKRISPLGRIIYGAAIACLVWAGLAVVAPAGARAATVAGLCYDAFSGVTYKCTDPGSVKVDGKSGGKFDPAKCYAFSDPNQGWQAADCSAAVFQQVVTLAPPIKNKDDNGNCIDTGSGSGCNISCPSNLANSGSCDIVARYINPLIKFLTISVGLLVAISLTVSGIQYGSARNNPQAINAAKTRIAATLLGFLGYSVLYFFLQWAVPGGFLNG